MMSTSPTPRPSAVGRYLSVAAEFSLKYAFEIIVLGMIVYMCVARGLSLSVDIYDPLEAQPAPSEATIQHTAPAVSNLQTVAPTSVFAPRDHPRHPRRHPTYPGRPNYPGRPRRSGGYRNHRPLRHRQPSSTPLRRATWVP